MTMKNMFNNQTFFIIFIFFAIVLLPFNGLPYFPVLGEMAVEGAFYAFALAIGVWFLFLLLSRPPLHLPVNAVSAILLIFFLWTILSGVANFGWINTGITKGRTGLEKYILQTLVLGFGLAVTWLFRFMGYWITLALGLIYMQKRTVREVKILGDNGNIK